MKKLSMMIAAALPFSMMTLMPLAPTRLEATEKILVYLTDPADEGGLDENGSSTQPSTQPSTTKPKNLDEAIKARKDLNDRQRRILKGVVGEQKEFVSLLNHFIEASYNAVDENSSVEFIQMRNRIVELTFRSQDEKLFYERLFLINALWLNNQDQVERFKSLDRELQDQSLKLEEKRRKIRNIITGVSAVGGAVIVGYLSYLKVLRPVLINPTESGLSDILRIGSRGAIVLIGTGVGAYLGGQIGFLGSSYLMSQQREFVDPVNGSMDLNELLDLIDSMK